jgi:hypothetical protein
MFVGSNLFELLQPRFFGADHRPRPARDAMLPAVSTSIHAPPPPRLTYACHLLVLVQVRCNSVAPSSCGRGETIAPLGTPAPHVMAPWKLAITAATPST